LNILQCGTLEGWRLSLDRSCEKWIITVRRAKLERNMLYTLKWRKAYWIGHILR